MKNNKENGIYINWYSSETVELYDETKEVFDGAIHAGSRNIAKVDIYIVRDGKVFGSRSPHIADYESKEGILPFTLEDTIYYYESPEYKEYADKIRSMDEKVLDRVLSNKTLSDNREINI